MARDGWTETELGSLIEVKHGFAFKGEYFKTEPPGDILLTPGNFAIGGGFKYDKLKYYDGPVPDDYVLDEGDLLVTMTDLSKAADTLGFPALVPAHAPEGPRYLHNQRLGLVIINKPSRIRKAFLYYLMCSREYRDDIVAGATGTTVKHTSPTKIKRFSALIPPPEQQDAIAEHLRSLDDKIDLNRRMNRALEGITRAIFKAWFVDFEPVKAKAEGATNIPGMPQNVFEQLPAQLRETPHGLAPVGWDYFPIWDLVEVVGGGTPRTKNPEFWEGGNNPFCTPKDMSRLSAPVLLDTERHITQAGVDKISSGQLPIGTVLLSSRAPIGYLALAATPVSVNQGIIAMLTGDIPNTYVLLWTEANMDEIKSRAGGSTFAEISKQNFRPIPALRPDDQTLRAFGEITEPLFDLITANERESDVLVHMRDTLLPKLISNEVRGGDNGEVNHGG